MIARRIRGPVAGVLALVVLGAACSSTAPKSSPSSTPTSTSSPGSGATAGSTSTSVPTATTAVQGCTPARPHPSGQSTQTFVYLGVKRTYQLYVPRLYRGTTSVPLVFDFHGFGSNAMQQIVYGNFMPLADRDDFVIVAPDGQGAARHFNLTSEKGLQNDIAMTLALLTNIEKTFCIDARRVYSTGMSDGGAMTSVLACVASDMFAAFGPVAVEIAPPSCKAHSVAMVAFHGTADPVVPYGGGKVNCCGGASLGSTTGAMASWAAHDHCATKFTDARLGTEVSRRTWTGCDGTSAVVLYSIIGGGHTWPGSIPIASLGMTTKQVDASSTIWDFFVAHPLSS